MSRKSIVISLLLLTIASAAAAATKTWTGAVNGLWSVAGNWTGGTPASGDSLVFPVGAANVVNTNDLSGLTLATVDITANVTTLYVMSGNAVTLNGGMTVSNLPTPGGTFPKWNVPTTLGATQTWTGVLEIGGTVNLNGFNLSFGSMRVAPAGTITGTGSIPTGTYFDVAGTISITGTVASIVGMNVDGAISAASVSASPLTGSGTLPTTIAFEINPSTLLGPTAILTTGNLTTNTCHFDLTNTTPGSGHDQLAVNGTVTLTGGPLQLSGPPSPSPGQSFVLIKNDGADPVSGTFSGYPEGTTFISGAATMQITYVGGTGNDVVVTVVTSSKQWTGSTNNLWSVAGNWTGGVPASGNNVVFPAGASNVANTNDLSGLTLSTVDITANVATLYVMTGNALTLTGGMTVSNLPTPGGTYPKWNIPTTLGATQSWSGTLEIGGTVNLNGFNLSFANARIAPAGTISGTGSIPAASFLDVAGTISITGTVTALQMIVDGTIAAASVSAGTLAGSGTLPVTNAGDVNPSSGLSPTAILTTGNLTASTIHFDLNNTTPGSGHDQLAVNGTVTLNNAIITGPSSPVAGQSFVLIRNDGIDPANGTFAGYPEGATFTIGAATMRITYIGGTGNDVVVTTVDPTTTSLMSSKNPTVSGEPFTLTAHVAAPATPTGTISFFDGATLLGTSAVNGSGDATLTKQLAAGAHPLVARYSGAATLGASNSPTVTQNVNPAATTTTLVITPNPVPNGSAFTVSGQVAPVSPGTGIPTGTVTIRIDGNVVANGPLDSTGHFSISAAAPAVGTHQITVTFGGSASYTTSASNVVTFDVSPDVPTLSEWMLVMLAIALAIAAARMVTKG